MALRDKKSEWDLLDKSDSGNADTLVKFMSWHSWFCEASDMKMDFPFCLFVLCFTAFVYWEAILFSREAFIEILEIRSGSKMQCLKHSRESLVRRIVLSSLITLSLKTMNGKGMWEFLPVFLSSFSCHGTLFEERLCRRKKQWKKEMFRNVTTLVIPVAFFMRRHTKPHFPSWRYVFTEMIENSQPEFTFIRLDGHC